MLTINDMSFVLIFVCVCVKVNGAWSCWSSWSQCSVVCGAGHYQRTRSCNSPATANGGDICIGLHTEEALCNTHTCDGKVTHELNSVIPPAGLGSIITPLNFVSSPSLNCFFHHFLMNKPGRGYMKR